MKRFLVFLLLSAISFLSFAANVTISPLGNMRIRGYVSHVCEISAQLNSEAMPFNMAGDDVKPVSQSALSTSPGLPIGTWSLFSDYNDLLVTFNVTPLSNGSESLNYYVQFSYPQTHDYDSDYTMFPVYSDGVDHQLDLTGLIYDGYVSFTGAKFYVRMEKDAEELSSSYGGGTYSSTVVIKVTVND